MIVKKGQYLMYRSTVSGAPDELVVVQEDGKIGPRERGFVRPSVHSVRILGVKTEFSGGNWVATLPECYTLLSDEEVSVYLMSQ